VNQNTLKSLSLSINKQPTIWALLPPIRSEIPEVFTGNESHNWPNPLSSASLSPPTYDINYYSEICASADVVAHNTYV
jgi:hypothetical protein